MDDKHFDDYADTLPTFDDRKTPEPEPKPQSPTITTHRMLEDREDDNPDEEKDEKSSIERKTVYDDAEKQERNTVSNAEDAGTEESYAVRYTAEGDPEVILLGVSGESVFENTDPNAQSLYLRLRQMFLWPF